MWNASNDNNVWTIKETPEIQETIECLIEKRAEKQIKALCKQYEDLEWLAGLIGYEDEEGIRITEIKLFEQEVSGGYVELTNKGSEEMAKTKTIGWIHSHNKMGVFFSSTDVKTSSFNQVSIVVNNKFEITGRTILKTTWGKQIFVPLTIYTEREDTETDPIIKEAEEMIKKKGYNTKITFNEKREYKKSKWYEKENISFDEKDVDEQFKDKNKIICAICNNPITMKRLVVDESIPYHDTCYDDFEEEMQEVCTKCGYLKNTCECDEEMRLWNASYNLY